MIRLGRGSIIDTFIESIPRAGSHADTYLRAVKDGIREFEPPVDLALDDIEGAGVARTFCLIATPTTRRLRFYQTCHFAVPNRSTLQMGYYLIGGDRAAGGVQLGGNYGIGVATDADAENVRAIVQMIHEYAVMPAIQRIADLVQFRPPDESGGFLGA